MSREFTNLGVANLRFGTQTLFVLVAISAIITVASRWLVSTGVSWEVAILMICLTVGSFVGITVTGKNHQSTLAGAILGAILATVVYPGLLVLYLSISFLLGGAIWGLAACVLALVAAAMACYERE